MSSEAICPMCEHLGPKSTCSNPQSPLSGKPVSKANQCSFFIASPGQAKYGEALRTCLAIGSNIPVIPLLQNAIDLGLPEDDELAARFHLYEGYREVWSNTDNSMEQIVAMPEFAKGLEEAERALELDAKGNYGYFAQPLNRARLDRLNYIYQMEARTIKDKDGLQAGIDYAERKLRLFSYLPSTPMYSLLDELARWYIESGQPDNAKRQYQAIVNSSIVNVGREDDHEQKVRDYAASKLAELSSTQALAPSCPEAPFQRKARNSIICGVIGLFIFGWLFGPIAVILGMGARTKLLELKANGTGKASTGIVLGAIASLIGCLQVFQFLMRLR